MCTVPINALEPRAFNPESQSFMPLFNKNFMTLWIPSFHKISLLCRQQPGGDEASNEG
jgi:hypothetical protein